MSAADLLLTVIAAAVAWAEPLAGLTLSLCSYTLRNLFVPIDASGAASDAPLVGVVLPVLVGGVIVARHMAKNRGHIRYNWVLADTAYILLGALLLAGTAYTRFPKLGFDIAVRFWILGVSYYFLARLCLSDRNRAEIERAIKRSMVVVWFAGLLVTLYSFAIHDELGAIARTQVGEASVIAVSVLLAHATAVNCFWLWGAAVRRVLPGLALCLGATVLLVGLVLAGTRGPIVALLIVTPLIALTARWHPNRPRGRALQLTLVLCAGVALLFQQRQDLLLPLAARLELQAQDGDESVQLRKSEYPIVFERFTDNPLFGGGTASWQNDPTTYPHNLFLEVMSDYGLMGLSVLAILMYACGRAMRDAFRRRDRLGGLVSALVLEAFTMAQFSESLHMHKFLYFNTGLLIAHSISSRDATQP